MFTAEGGTISGELDLRVDTAGHGLVRYRHTSVWYTIGNLDDDPPRTWANTAELVAAVTAEVGRRDAAGNTIPFEA
ncbi:MAG: hypothetical protein J2P17_23130 [Mycobacterium sp.]|nr:hypothetical protein [Mycobacterium sp.]